MNKRSVQSVKNSLKFKAQPRSGVLSVRIGVKKYLVPMDARILSDSEYIFLSFPACSELFRVQGKVLEAMHPDEDATAAFEALSPRKRRGGRRSSPPLPDDLAAALSTVPPGYKVGYDAAGRPRLVKKRVRDE